MKTDLSPAVRQTLPAMRVMLFVAALLVLSVGIPLNLLTEQTDRYFAWTIATPLTAAFLGAGYWSSCLLELLAARERLWVHARIAVPGVLLFTTLTLLVTLLHIDKFHLGSPDLITRLGTWVWLFVYAVVPPIMGILWILQLRAPGADPPRSMPGPTWLRLAIAVQAAIMIPLGIALLLVPEQVAPLWAWSLTTLTGRALGAWIVSIGVVAAQAIWENDMERVRLASISFAVIGALELIALARFMSDVHWTSASAWLYVLFLISLLLVGASSWWIAKPSAGTRSAG